MIRLDRLLANRGLGTRREVHGLIRAGRVTLDGKPITDGAAHVDPSSCLLALDGEPIDGQPAPIVMMNKPSGVLTANGDSQRRTVVDLLPDCWRARKLMPVGRLDIDTTGLLLFTDDGELTHRLLNPKRHIDKLYRAVLDAPITDDDITAFAQGIPLKDFRALPAQLTRDQYDSMAALVVVQEGKFHQVKRMFAACGRLVITLERLSIGPIHLDEGMKPGQCRSLTVPEEAALRSACGADRIAD
ncbi:pseudouridine synthase [Clostridia bacterium]|nr:pseudouridine synthase [Clostridia bacterium]